MQTLMQDLRYGLRLLARRPGFTAVTVLSLGLGIGLNTAIFSVINGLLFRPFPAKDPGALVSIFKRVDDGPLRAGHSYPDYLDLRANTDVFAGLAAHQGRTLRLGPLGESVRVSGETVSANFFDVLGITPILGRTFAAEEDGPGAAVAVVAHGLWQRHLDGSADVIGRPLVLDGHSFTVIGVVPPTFRGLEPGPAVEVWIPVATTVTLRAGSQSSALQERGNRWLSVTGRLKPGVSVAQASAAVEAVSRRLENEHPDSNAGVTAAAVPATRFAPRQRAKFVPVLALLLGAVTLILLIACANVANLLLARAAARRKEMGIRLALGASPRQVVRQLLSECIPLSLLGAGVALLLAVWTPDLFAAVVPEVGGPLSLDIGPDGRVLAYTLALAMLTALASGLAPAWQASRTDVITATKEEAFASASRPRLRLRRALAVGQLALSLVLLIGAGLLLKAFHRSATIHPGFETARVWVVPLDPPLYGYRDAAASSFLRQLVQRARALPGVAEVSLASIVPLGSGYMAAGIGRESRSDMLIAGFNTVSPGYLRTLGIPLLAGRDFDERDVPGAPPVAIVNAALAARLWPGRDPLGRPLPMGERDLTVVGVTPTVTYRNLGEPPQPHFYLPFAQHPRESPMLLVRAEGDLAALEPALREVVRGLDPRMQPIHAGPLRRQVERFHESARTTASLSALLAGLAMLLAFLGVYGVVAYLVSQQTREIGIRVALGAGHRDVLRMVLRQGLRLWLAGAAIGVTASVTLTRLLTADLYGVSPTDPLTFAGVCLFLLLVVAVATYPPARRAVRVDPVVALRSE